MLTLYQGPWQETLKGIDLPERRRAHIIADPPFSERTHKGQRSCDELNLSKIKYSAITVEDIREFVEFWSEKVFWMIVFSDHLGFRLWSDACESVDRVTFAPVVWLKPNSTPRFSGDGPTSSCEYICVSRPRVETRCGSLPGYYICNTATGGNILSENFKSFVGSKPLNLMRALVRDYTKPGDLVIDPYAGTGTTLLAAAMENRDAIGSELDPNTYKRAKARLDAGIQQPLFV